VRSLLGLLLLLAGSAVPVLADPVQPPVHQTVALSGPGSVSIEGGGNVRSNVRVTGWSQDNVQVDVTTAPADRDKVNVFLDSSRSRVSLQVKGAGSGFFMSGGPSATVQIELHVPSASKVAIEVVTGSIGVANVNGPLVVSSVNGDVTVSGAGPVLKVETVNGKVNATVRSSDAAPRISIETVNGDVTLSVPKNFSTPVVTHTINGKIENSRSEGQGAGKASVSTVNGSITVRS